MCKICIFAGTSEGRQVIEGLQGRGASITACAATEYGGQTLEDLQGVAVHTGRMDEPQMERFLQEQGFDLVIDATHPYADTATQNIAAACMSLNIPCLRVGRSSERQSQDGLFFADAQECAEYLKTVSGNVLLTTGSKELHAFTQDEALKGRVFARVLPIEASLAECAACGLKPSHILAMQGPFDLEMNLATLRFVQARYLVTKDTGDAGGYAAKIQATREAGAVALIIGRPQELQGMTVEAVIAEAVSRFSLPEAKKKVVLAGIGMGSVATRTVGLESALRSADLIIGAKRMLESIDTQNKRTLSAIAPNDIVEAIRRDPGKTALVLLSGDSGFYSGAKRLIALLNQENVSVLPGISSLQYLAARLQRSWEDITPVSLHGRDLRLADEILTHKSVFALLGGSNTARAVLTALQEAGLGSLQATVGENLGYPEESITTDRIDRLAGMDFAPLSVLLVDNPEARPQDIQFGLPDSEFDRSDTPMTKSEIRAISMSKLCLTPDSVVYDIGSGSGSVTVEAALIARQGTVYAIEVKPDAMELTRQNANKFHLHNVQFVEGRAPEALEALPIPTHAFIGGSGGELPSIIDCLLQKNPAVRIVANAVTLESVAALTQLAQGFRHSDIACVNVSKPRKLGRYNLMNAMNPVYIFTLWNDNEEANQA